MNFNFRFNNLFSSHERTCTKDYLVPETNITIQKSRIVKIFFNAVENDEKNYKNPKCFDPDNFLPENEPNKFAYQTFGQGPRACPGKMIKCLINNIVNINNI